MKYYAIIAERLNERGILPFSAREWNIPLIQRIIYGKSKDQDAIDAVAKIEAELESEGITTKKLSKSSFI